MTLFLLVHLAWVRSIHLVMNMGHFANFVNATGSGARPLLAARWLG